MILEGIVTTQNEDGGVNISPMGPIVDETMTHLVLRPYRTSTTYQNLKRNGAGILHITDDVELIARAAVGRLEESPPMLELDSEHGHVLADACRWYAFRVRKLHDRNERTTIQCDVVEQGWLRDFFGFNRAKHAVLEAAILATRISLLPAEHVRAEMKRLSVMVEKTAGPQERRAFDFLSQYLEETLSPSGE
ncbi:MAG: DUF447 family protein [Pirellulaceae bacterium]